MTIEELIRDAWSGTAAPDRDAITQHSCPECDDIAETFADKRWEDLQDVELLRYNGASLTLFAAPAFHYYLPAFMLATLHDPRGADLIPDFIMWDTERELGKQPRGWMLRFTATQRQALAAFFRQYVALGIVDEEDEIDMQLLAEKVESWSAPV